MFSATFIMIAMTAPEDFSTNVDDDNDFLSALG